MITVDLKGFLTSVIVLALLFFGTLAGVKWAMMP